MVFSKEGGGAATGAVTQGWGPTTTRPRSLVVAQGPAARGRPPMPARWLEANPVGIGPAARGRGLVTVQGSATHQGLGGGKGAATPRSQGAAGAREERKQVRQKKIRVWVEDLMVEVVFCTNLKLCKVVKPICSGR